MFFTSATRFGLTQALAAWKVRSHAFGSLRTVTDGTSALLRADVFRCARQYRFRSQVLRAFAQELARRYADGSWTRSVPLLRQMTCMRPQTSP